MNFLFIVKKRADDYQVYPAGVPSRWECGKTKIEALGKWMVTHGTDCGIQIEIGEHTVEIKTKS